MNDSEWDLVQDACEREAARQDYPAGFPALPDIPAARYSDERLYALEMEHVWRRTWLLAAHVSELPERGSYRLFEQIDQSIIISRGQDDVVRAFHNICRHRAAPLVTEVSGRTRRFLCPYHAWSYALDGTLVAVPREQDFPCLDRGLLGLMPVRCETWRGHIFINLDEQAKPLLAHLGSVPEHCQDFPFEGMAVRRYSRIEVDCNWKVAYDNFIETYHIATVHPAIMRWLDIQTFSVSLLRGGHSHYKTRRRNGNRIVTDEARTPDGSFELFQHYAINLPIFPNVAGGLDAGGFMWQRFWPAGPNRTIIESPLYVLADEHAADPDYIDTLMAENLRLLGEDMRLFPAIDRAIRSGHITRFKMSYGERGISWYHEEIDRMIGPDRIPPELRMTQVLADHVVD